MYILRCMGKILGKGTTTAVARWGNSTGIRIPKAIAELTDLQEGDSVHVEAKGRGVIVIRVIKDELTLNSLVSRITPKNRHGEADWGSPKGHEVW